MAKSGKACEVMLYPDAGWTVEKIISVINEKSVKYYSIILHDRDKDENGNYKKPHFHVYLSFGGYHYRFSTVASWFNVSEALVEKIKARGRNSPYHCIVYQTHKNQPDKAQYDISEIVANFDVAAYIAQHENDTDFGQVLEMINSGEITRQNFSEYISIKMYSDNKKKIENAFDYVEQRNKNRNNGNRDMVVYWICGNSGAGKTTLAKMIAEEIGDNMYITSQGMHPFDLYKNEQICCMDDLRPNTPYSFVETLMMLDNHTSRPINARYRDKVPEYSTMVVTSVLSPAEFYVAFHAPEEDPVQLFRRITQVWRIEGDTIDLLEYDDNSKGFTLVKTIPNPVPGFVAKMKPVEGKKANFEDVIARLSEKYHGNESCVSEPVVFHEIEDDSDNPFERR